MSGATDALLAHLGDALLHGTVLAGLTALVCATLLRRARPSLHAALWTVVLLKFLVPVGPELPVSLGGAIDAGLRAGDALWSAPGGGAGLAVVGSAMPEADPWAPLKLALVLSYAAAVAWILGRRVVGHLRLRRAVYRLPSGGEELGAAARRAAARAGGVRRLPELRVGESGPFLLGLFRPILVVPHWLTGPAREAALIHELAHLRRADPMWRLLEIVCRALFFFWPVVAYAASRLDRAREAACDQWAVARGPLDRTAYGELLLAVARKRAAPAPAAAALVPRRSGLEARIDALLQRAPRGRLGLPLAAGVALWATVCLAGTAGGAGEAQLAAELECELSPGIGARILARHPGADTDGDGELSRAEICAHQLRMKQRLVDGVVDAELVSRIDPAADADGDGVLSESEIEAFKDRVQVSVKDGPNMSVARREVTLEVGGRQSLAIPARGVEVDVAEAGGSICAQNKCLARAAPEPTGTESRLLIDVAFTGAD